MQLKLSDLQIGSIGPNIERIIANFFNRNARLLAVTMGFSVLAYGYSLVNFSLSLDEELKDPFGHLGSWNIWWIDLYRWGISLFNFAVVGGGNIPFLRPLVALGILSVTATVYSGMLPIAREARYYFCISFVTVPTFAYMLTFSFLSIESALSIFLFVFGLRFVVESVGSPSKTYSSSLAGLLLWVMAAALYQDYGVVLTAYLALLFFRLANGERYLNFREVFRVGGILACSVILYASISILLVWIFSRTERDLYLEKIFLTGVGNFLPTLQSIVEVYFYDTIYGTQTFKFAALGLLFFGALTRGSILRRAGMLALGGAICFAPFLYGLGAMPPMRASSGLLFVIASFSALAITASAISIAFFAKCFVIFLTFLNCVSINNIFYYESLSWDADKMLATNLAQRIYMVAPDIHADHQNVRILFVGSYQRKMGIELKGTQSWVNMWNTWGINKVYRRKGAMIYAGFPDFRLASREDYDAKLPIIQKMSEWPDSGSVLRSDDIVIVKLGAETGFELY